MVPRLLKLLKHARCAWVCRDLHLVADRDRAREGTNRHRTIA